MFKAWRLVRKEAARCQAIVSTLQTHKKQQFELVTDDLTLREVIHYVYDSRYNSR